jgi:hypothetical protein
VWPQRYHRGSLFNSLNAGKCRELPRRGHECFLKNKHTNKRTTEISTPWSPTPNQTCFTCRRYSESWKEEMIANLNKGFTHFTNEPGPLTTWLHSVQGIFRSWCITSLSLSLSYTRPAIKCHCVAASTPSDSCGPVRRSTSIRSKCHGSYVLPKPSHKLLLVVSKINVKTDTSLFVTLLHIKEVQQLASNMTI